MHSLVRHALVRHALVRRAIVIAALAAASPVAAPLAAQEARLVARLDAGTRTQVAEIVDQARARRLPTEPLVDKALEGASKRAPSDQIVAVVRRLAENLAKARAVLGPDATDAEVSAAASLLQKGADPEALRQLHRGRGRASMVVAFGVAQEFIGRGVQADSALGAIAAMREVGLDDADLLEVQRNVMRNLALDAVASPTRIMSTTVETFMGPARSAGGGRKPKP